MRRHRTRAPKKWQRYIETEWKQFKDVEADIRREHPEWFQRKGL